jgi:SsrA-binding protein
MPNPKPAARAKSPLAPKAGGRKTGEAGTKPIAENRAARHEYFIEDDVEAGLALEGWEVKALRDGRANLKESYAVFRNGEGWLLRCHIMPLPSASTHVEANPVRDRKLLLHRRQIDRLAGAVDRQGYTLVPLVLYWSQGRAKLKLGLAKGKQAHDKRASIKERDWQRQKSRILKKG